MFHFYTLFMCNLYFFIIIIIQCKIASSNPHDSSSYWIKKFVYGKFEFPNWRKRCVCGFCPWVFQLHFPWSVLRQLVVFVELISSNLLVKLLKSDCSPTAAPQYEVQNSLLLVLQFLLNTHNLPLKNLMVLW